MNYELSLLVDAIESQLTKEKRRRGRCERSIFILPIQKNIPEDFAYKCPKCSEND